ncbi:hypothetical protein DFQ30_002957 [Apophysomyces sp. BC1015]|nr:hypothetical protein DFQ30_002957 [Apophysomyces sp. BC1015]KAG0180852.1 hypothetical protein DFQ29_009991 [Apophysomyces sp. BC1021]
MNTYNRKQRVRKTRKLGTKAYKANDGRVPDTTELLMANISENVSSEPVQKKPKLSVQQNNSKTCAKNQIKMGEDIEAIVFNDSDDLGHLIETDLCALEPTDTRIAEETNWIKDIDPATANCVFKLHAKSNLYLMISFTHIYIQFDIKMEEHYSQANEIVMSEPYFEEVIGEVDLYENPVFAYDKLVLLADDRTTSQEAKDIIVLDLQSKAKI